MSEHVTSVEEVMARYGVDPRSIGLRHRGWWIVTEIEDEEEQAGAKIGDLCVKARDGGCNAPDPAAFRAPSFRGTACDSFDETYRYYYFAPLEEATADAD
ncbi:MAG: hypothetical protein IMW98_08540 [Firmicutes bacterium]|nr:hypothetical protein [Bacillota bacterium]MBE3590853.1 hypothetical protein [Bacillota bacterium]